MADTPHLVERRRRYIQRQIELGAPSVNVSFQHARPEGTGPPNRHGMPRLPVGQHAVKNWPVLDLGEQPDVPLDAWRLEVVGLVENPVTLDVDSVPGAAAGRGRQRLPLRHDLEPLRQSLGRRAVQNHRRARRATGDRRVRALHRIRSRTGHLDPLHDQSFALTRHRRGCPARAHLGRTALAARARRAMPDDHAQALCLERHEVDSKDRIPFERPARLLGGPGLLRYGGAVVQRSVLRLIGDIYDISVASEPQRSRRLPGWRAFSNWRLACMSWLKAPASDRNCDINEYFFGVICTKTLPVS